MPIIRRVIRNFSTNKPVETKPKDIIEEKQEEVSVPIVKKEDTQSNIVPPKEKDIPSPSPIFRRPAPRRVIQSRRPELSPAEIAVSAPAKETSASTPSQETVKSAPQPGRRRRTTGSTSAPSPESKKDADKTSVTNNKRRRSAITSDKQEYSANNPEPVDEYANPPFIPDPEDYAPAWSTPGKEPARNLALITEYTMWPGDKDLPDTPPPDRMNYIGTLDWLLSKIPPESQPIDPQDDPWISQLAMELFLCQRPDILEFYENKEKTLQKDMAMSR